MKIFYFQGCLEQWLNSRPAHHRGGISPCCEICKTPFVVSYTAGNRGVKEFLFSPNTPPIVLCIYLSLLYLTLFVFFFWAPTLLIKSAVFLIIAACFSSIFGLLIWYQIILKSWKAIILTSLLNLSHNIRPELLGYFWWPTLVFGFCFYCALVGYMLLFGRWCGESETGTDANFVDVPDYLPISLVSHTNIKAKV